MELRNVPQCAAIRVSVNLSVQIEILTEAILGVHQVTPFSHAHKHGHALAPCPLPYSLSRRPFCIA